MKETSETLKQQTLWDISMSICSQESEPLLLGCDGQGIQAASEPLREVFPAKMCLMQGNERELKESIADSGKRCAVSFRKRWIAAWDRISSSWKTSQLLFTGDYQQYSGIWPKSGWMQDGSVYELQMSERPTSESEYSLWPTPRAEKIGGYSSPDYRPTLAQKVQMWPTPAAQDGKNATCPPSQADRDTLPGSMWRTPQADENGSIKPPEERKGHNLSISNQVQGNLNPEWVEMLQGFPVGYTDISGPQVQGSHSMNGSLQEPLLASNPIGQSA